jgi:hypothetical protein
MGPKKHARPKISKVWTFSRKKYRKIYRFILCWALKIRHINFIDRHAFYNERFACIFFTILQSLEIIAWVKTPLPAATPYLYQTANYKYQCYGPEHTAQNYYGQLIRFALRFQPALIINTTFALKSCAVHLIRIIWRTSGIHDCWVITLVFGCFFVRKFVQKTPPDFGVFLTRHENLFSQRKYKLPINIHKH